MSNLCVVLSPRIPLGIGAMRDYARTNQCANVFPSVRHAALPLSVSFCPSPSVLCGVSVGFLLGTFLLRLIQTPILKAHAM